MNQSNETQKKNYRKKEKITISTIFIFILKIHLLSRAWNGKSLKKIKVFLRLESIYKKKTLKCVCVVYVHMHSQKLQSSV